MLCRDNWWLLAFFRQPPIIGDELKSRMVLGEASIRGLRPPFGSGRPHSRNLAGYRNRQFTQITALHKLDFKPLFHFSFKRRNVIRKAVGNINIRQPLSQPLFPLIKNLKLKHPVLSLNGLTRQIDRDLGRYW